MLTTKDIRKLMNEGKEIKLLHTRKKNGPTFVVDSNNLSLVYGQVARVAIQNFDTELSAVIELYDIRPTVGIKPV